MSRIAKLKAESFERGEMPKYWAGLNAEMEVDSFLQRLSNWFKSNSTYCVQDAGNEFRLLYTEEGDTVRYSIEELPPIPHTEGVVFCIASSVGRGGFWSDPIPLSNWRDTAAF